ncbi:MAG: hypothetical protein ACXAB7_09830 [Candidatus Kariarchaeaceae archaeon]|jgi:hypothetical protein
MYTFLVIFGLVLLEVLFKVNDSYEGFRFAAIITFFLIFLTWLMILTYNVSRLAIDYAFPDEIYMKSGVRRKRLIRSTFLIGSFCGLILITIYLVDFATGKFLNLISWTVFSLVMNIFFLRMAFLILGPEENPYFPYKQRN